MSDAPVEAAESRSGSSRYLLAVPAGAAAIFYFYWYISTYSAYAADDAFIHLRIARNFVESGAPYYNPGQAVAGSSSPLWTVLLTALFSVFGPRFQLLPVVAWVCTIGVFCACTWILSERFSVGAAIAAAFVIVSVLVLPVSASLMETPAALLFFALSVICFARARFAAFGALSALAFAVRYEFALWLVLGFAFAEGRKGKARYLCGAAAPLAFVVWFNHYYFGAFIPNTVWAKSKVYTLSAEEFVTEMGVDVPSFIDFVAVNVLVAVQCLRRKPPAWANAAGLFAVGLFALYGVTRTFIFPWYRPLLLLPLVIACALAPLRGRFWVLALLVVALRTLPIASAEEAYGLLVADPGFYREYMIGARVRQYLRIGDELSHLFPNAVVMAPEIGGLGWTFHGRIIDAIGLVSPECLRFHPLKVPEERAIGSLGAIPPQAVQELAPDVVVSMEKFSQAFKRAMASGAIDNYALFRNYPVVSEEVSKRSGARTVWDSLWTQVYVRRAEGS